MPLYQRLEKEEESTRVLHTTQILQSLKQETQNYVKAYESLFEAYFKLILQEEVTKGKKIRLPLFFTSSPALRNWSCLPVLTASLPVLPLQQLKSASLPLIASFGKHFSVVATGITAPKKVECASQDGKKFIQLLKRDEIRSDVVIQQLLLLLNDLLLKERVVADQEAVPNAQITLRTYKVRVAPECER